MRFRHLYTAPCGIRTKWPWRPSRLEKRNLIYFRYLPIFSPITWIDTEYALHFTLCQLLYFPSLVIGLILSRYLEILSYFPRYRLNSVPQNQAGLESLNLDVVQNVATGEIRKYGTWYTNYRVKEIITIILNQLNQILWTLFLRLSF